MTNENELFKDVPSFSTALGTLVKFSTKVLATLPKDSELWAEGDKALNDITLAALRNLVTGATHSQRQPEAGHDPYGR